MKIEFYTGNLIDKKYPRLYSQGDGSKVVCLFIDDKYKWEIFTWLEKKYENEKINLRDKFLAGKRVLIVSSDVNLSEEIYFEIGGNLYNVYINDLLEELLNDFLCDMKNNENNTTE